MAKRHIVIVDDQTILRVGLRALVSAISDFEVVGEAANGRDAVRCVGQTLPDLVLMDLSMPVMTGFDAIAEIHKRYPETKILVLTIHQNEEYIRAALEAGAHGYLLKDAGQQELEQALRKVLDGKVYLSSDVAAKVVCGYVNSNGKENALPATSWESLTARERQVLKLIAEGHTNKGIAEFLCISAKTVEKHRANLMSKLNLHSVSALTAFAFRKGLLAE